LESLKTKDVMGIGIGGLSSKLSGGRPYEGSGGRPDVLNKSQDFLKTRTGSNKKNTSAAIQKTS